jgi:aryl-alcohol dehydrogenase-like predicted oxidoreductase
MTNDSRMSPREVDFSTPPLGVGTWSWGDVDGWGYGRTYDEGDLRRAFDVLVGSGIRFFDSGERYGMGMSESLLGKFLSSAGSSILLATKFSPRKWQIRRRDLIAALRRSLVRLRVRSVDLYQLHWPSKLVSVGRRAEALADALDLGLAKAAGVSNCNCGQMLAAYESLRRRGYSLASNQVEFSLLHRTPETLGLLKECSSKGVTLIAYSPLAMGMLTGKYTTSAHPPGFRDAKYAPHLSKIANLVRVLREIGESNGGKTSAQVAVNWVISKGAFPIVGVKTMDQAEEIRGSFGWNLSSDDIQRLDDASTLVQI